MKTQNKSIVELGVSSEALSPTLHQPRKSLPNHSALRARSRRQHCARLVTFKGATNISPEYKNKQRLVSNYQILSNGKHINKLQFLFLVRVLCFLATALLKLDL